MYNMKSIKSACALSVKKNYLPIPSCSLSNLAISATYSILTLQAAWLQMHRLPKLQQEQLFSSQISRLACRNQCSYMASILALISFRNHYLRMCICTYTMQSCLGRQCGTDSLMWSMCVCLSALWRQWMIGWWWLATCCNFWNLVAVFNSVKAISHSWSALLAWCGRQNMHQLKAHSQ